MPEITERELSDPVFNVRLQKLIKVDEWEVDITVKKWFVCSNCQPRILTVVVEKFVNPKFDKGEVLWIVKCKGIPLFQSTKFAKIRRFMSRIREGRLPITKWQHFYNSLDM